MYRSIAQRLAALDRRLLSTDRFVDICLQVQTHEGEILCTVGARWDKTARRWDGEATNIRVVKLKPDQEEVGRAVALYLEQRLANDDTRKALIMGIGDRGGGKTFIGSLLLVLIAIAIAGSASMAVSIFSQQNGEIREGIEKICDPSWFEHDTSTIDPKTKFLTGSRVHWFTSRNPKKLRQAQIPWELVFINEGQDQTEKVFLNSIAAVRNVGGLNYIATNPPTEDQGDWIAVLYQALEVDQSDGAAYVIKAASNDNINQSSRDKAGRLMAHVNRAQSDADHLGIIKLSGTVGYPNFTRLPRLVDDQGRWLSGHIAERGIDWVDVTREITAAQLGSKVGFDCVAGGDFQTEPGSCAPIAKLYRTQNGKGPLLLYIVEFVGTTGTESDLTIALQSRGYFPGNVDHEGNPAQSCLIVGDATGARQNAEHRKRDPYSFTQLRADGWHVLPPAYYGPKKTPWNPLIPDSRKQMKSLHGAGAIAYSPQCAEAQEGFPSLIDSMQRAKVNSLGKFEKKGHYTHGADGVRYLAWRYLPRAVVQVVRTMDVAAFDKLAGIKVGG